MLSPVDCNTPPPLIVNRSQKTEPLKVVFPFMITVPEGAMTIPLNELPPFNVTPPAATLKVSHRGFAAEPIEPFTVIDPPMVNTTGPTT